MASGKARGIKRVSATTSYSSATTIVIFVGLSVLGLWLLTSKSFTPPQPATVTTTIPTRITSIGNHHHHHPQTHHSSDPDPVHVDRSTDDTKADEAVVVEEPETKPETKPENAESQPDHGGVKTEATDQQDTKGSDEQDSTEESKKQAALEIQTSEESSMTQKQVVEQIIDEHPNSQINVATNATDHGSDAAENQITDEDQQKRIDEHQQKGDEQNQQQQEAQSKDPNGATSHDQVQHDEVVVPVDSHQEAIKQETKHESLDEVSSSIPEESTESKKSWTTQAHQSEDQKERRKTGSDDKESSNHGHTWLLCNVTAGADYIPCLDNEKVIASIHSRSHHEHRERHCPEDPPTCLVPLPQGYKRRVEWPQSRNKVRLMII